MPAAQPTSSAKPETPPEPPAASPRQLGRFQLRRLVGKSSMSMLWLALDKDGAEVHLLLPRKQPAGADAMNAWIGRATLSARLQHPRIVPVLEIGIGDGWPFVASARAECVTLEERLASGDAPLAQQAAQWLCDLLGGLAFLHEGGAMHGDLNLHTILIDPQDRALLMPLSAEDPAVALGATPGGPAPEAGTLAAQRAAMGRDMQACGLLLHRLLSGQPALGEKDMPTAVMRMKLEIIRLGWTMRQPVPDALRAIANRATERDPQRRYIGARSLERALQGWISSLSDGDDGILAMLLDRLRSIGHLPALPGLTKRLAAVMATDRLRLDEVIEVIIQDPALAFELLRQVNTAQFGGQEEVAVTTVRRAVQLIGLQTLQRTATAMRPWPGPLSPQAADALALEVRSALMAGHVARTLCPADMDGEAAYLIALLQSLGPLLIRYHFPDEAEQMSLLIDPPEARARGMDESAAAFAVIGVEVSTIAVAVAQHWGLDEATQQVMRRMPATAPVRSPDSRDEMLRLIACAAIEAISSLGSREARQNGASAALSRVNVRYARALVLEPNELSSAVHSARQAVDLWLPLNVEV